MILLSRNARVFYRILARDKRIYVSSCCFVYNNDVYAFHTLPNCMKFIQPSTTLHFVKKHICLPQNCTKDVIIHILVSEFQCSEKAATTVADALSSQKFSEPDLINYVSFLKSIGFDKTVIYFLPNILINNSSCLPAAVKCLHALHYDIKPILPLLSVPHKKLLNATVVAAEKTDYYPEMGKIKWLSHLFQCDESVLSKKLVKHVSVLHLPPEYILDVIETLKDGGIKPSTIVYDMKVFSYRLSSMHERLGVLKKNGIENARPWCIGCPQEVFERSVERRVASLSVLGDYKTNREYLAARLGCGEDAVDQMARKVPQVSRMTPSKAKKVLDFLFREGFSSEDVRLMPRILTRRVDTLASRIRELRAVGCEDVRTFVLCKTRKEYSRWVTNFSARMRAKRTGE